MSLNTKIPPSRQTVSKYVKGEMNSASCSDKLSIQGSRLTDQDKKLIQEIAERERAALGMDSDPDPDENISEERKIFSIIHEYAHLVIHRKSLWIPYQEA